MQEIVDIVDQLSPYRPPFIDVTSHAAVVKYIEHDDGTIEKKVIKKRPGTIGICGIIQNRFKIDTVAHILCEGFTKEETEDALIELHYLGVHNVMALRGDTTNYKKPIINGRSVNTYTTDLIHQLNGIKQGEYLSKIKGARPLNFCVGVAGYPEKHYEAPNLKADIENLKKKIDAGAEYIVTQMFFNNESYFKYVENCRNEGITVPIVPGMKVINNIKQLKSICKNFYIDFPEELVEELNKFPDHARQIGINWAKRQAHELLNAGVPYLHYYIMNNTSCVLEVVKEIQ